jgi:hypothetical protein
MRLFVAVIVAVAAISLLLAGSASPGTVAAHSARPVADPGSYSGQNGQNGNGITFYVAPGGKSILNISDTATALACTPGGHLFGDHLAIPKAVIRSDGSFTAKASQQGVVATIAGSPATYTYTFAGHFEGPTPRGAATVAGTWREDVVLASGAIKLCTSNDQFWWATRS